MGSVSIDLKSNELVIRAPLTIPPDPSKSEKNLVIASTHGPMITGARFDNKPITIGVNAYVPVKRVESVDSE